MKANEAIYICGATASGKTAYALSLAQEIGGEIVNGDSLQLYRGIEVLSAAPSTEERAQVRHHLFGIFLPGQNCDAGQYANMALSLLEEIRSRGKIPIVVGGSGLYLKFLTHGASPLPRGNEKLRAEFHTRTLEDLWQELEKLDPVEAASVDRQNPRYVSRALEICRLTGERVSELRDRWEKKSREVEAKLNGIWLRREREELHARIAQRTKNMLDGGAIQEVAALQGISGNWAKAIGVKEIQSFLSGAISREQCEEQIVFATRQYAKRQETWFRREAWLQQLPLF